MEMNKWQIYQKPLTFSRQQFHFPDENWPTDSLVNWTWHKIQDKTELELDLTRREPCSPLNCSENLPIGQ